MDIQVKKNRENLYKSLISQGFFVDDNGEPELTVDEFGEQVSDEENVIALYENLIDAEVLVDANGNPLMSQEDFLLQILGRYAQRDFYPITENQRGLFIDWEMHRDTTQYNLPDIRRFTDVTAERLRDILVEAVNAHPYVKMHFAMQDGDVVQVRCDNDPVEIPIYEINEKPTSEFFQARLRPFNLLEGPLYRFEIYKTPAGLYMFQDIHHTVNDGFSLLVLQSDIDKALKGEEIEPEVFSYFDHSLAEAKKLSGEEGEKAQEYFDKLLEQKESTAYPHSSENTTTEGMGMYTFLIPNDGIEDYCRKAGMTSNAYFATVLSQILHRVTREESVLFYTIDNGRTDSKVMKTIGMYVKTLPVTSTINFDATNPTSFEKAAKEMNDQLIKTVSYSYYPLTMMSERHHIHPEILYVYHGKIEASSDDDGHDKDISITLDTVKVPLTVTVFLKGESAYSVRLSYNTAFYSEADMAKLASAFSAATLNSINIDTVAQFSMLDDKERQRVDGFRSTCKQDIPWKLYYQPIEENAVKYADRTALIAKDRTLTFAEFNVEANRVAHALIRRGVKRGDRIVLLLPRRSGVIVSMFGVSKAGAAYIPCDPEYPADRINLIMTDSEAQYVITTADHAADYPAEKVILIDDIYNTGNTTPEDDLNPNVEVSPEDIAYLIYTSGSTGRPKGVMLRHVGIANYLYPHPANIHIQGLIDLGVKSFVCITTLSFDMSLKEFAGSLFNGITSVLADEQEVMDAHLLADLMKRTGAEGINGTCSRILAYMELNDFCEALRHCKTVWSGGEKYPMQLLEQLQELGVHVFNTYGPTEITVSSNIADLTQAKKVTVGHPLLNYEEFIVDQFGQELPVGFVGELLIGGPGVARGYNNLPEMTAERFVEYNGVRVYRSGDLARWEDNGEVAILGRNDGQVKLRGFRVELGEIEGIAAKYAGIRQAVADVKSVGAAQQLCLYYTSDAEIDEEALKAFLSESLTEYMVPTAYIRIDRIPLTPNGKTNRKALPAPKMEIEEIVPPANETEETILELMKKQLKIEELGVTTNLVSVGLSSLAAMRISANLMQQTGQTLATKDIIMKPTVRQLAAMLNNTQDDTEQQDDWSYEVRENYPLSENQRGIYIDWDMNRDTTQYNIPYAYKFPKMDVEQLIAAVKSSVAAHPYLKSHVVKIDNDVMLCRRDDAEFEVTIVELPEEPGKSYFQNKVRPFDLLSDDLLRIEVIKTPQSVYLFIDIHHLIYDGLSEGVFLGDIFKAYQGMQLDKERVTAFDFALYEDELLKGESYKKAEDFFDHLVGGLNVSSFMNSATPDNVPSGTVDVHIPSKDINAYCSTNGVTVGSYLQAAFALTLSMFTREEQPLYLTISAGRGAHAGLMHSVGMFVKTLPVTSKIEKGITSVGYTKQMHEVLQQTYAQDFYPYTHLVERHGIRAEIMFIYQGGLMEGTAPEGAEIIPLDLDTVKFPLDVTAYPDGDNFAIHIEYDGMKYSKYDMQLFVNAIGNVAENLAKANLLSEVSLLSPAEESEVAQKAMGKTLAVDPSQTFPSLLIKQAEKTPENIAVVDEQGSYTYAELNVLTEAVAKHIADNVHAKHSPFISIMLGYQKEFLVAAIGIEKAGYAYVPLDYDYPNDRLLFMIEDSESSLLITSHAIFDEKNANGEFDSYQDKLFFIDDFLAACDTKQFTGFNLATPEGIAYMIYTSGSTGKPKGVMIPHAAKANFVQFIAKEWHHTEKSHICCHSSFSFDASIEDLYPVLTVGGTLYTVPQEARKDLAMLHDFIVKNGITGGCYTTQLGQMLLQMFPDLPVDYLVVGGEKMTIAPECKCRLINTYGPTEFTVDATFFDVEPGKEYRNIPIGRALDNLAAYVVDSFGHLVPNGVAGELCMAGPQMAAGYWKREDLTSEKFSEITIQGKQVKVYHTGDLVRYNAENQIEYLGRIDNQIKLRGFRIELGEIETLIGKFEGIQMESVQVREVGGVQHLCAYYTADREIDQEALRSFLAEELTDYMVPTAYMQLDEMPLTPNGKVNTKALPNPDIQADEIVAPVTPSEKALFKLAAEMLKHEQFGITSNLIAMGLTSLSAMRFTMAAFNKFGVQLSVKEVLQHPTIHQLAAMIDSKKMPAGTQEVQEVNNIWPYGKQYYYPITENQRGVFLDWELNRDTTQYNVPEVHVMKDCDAEKLRQALEKVVNAHPYLKTHFVQHEGDVMQIRRDEEPVEVLMETLTEAPDVAFFQSRVRPFDLYNDTLYRMELYTFESKVYFFMDIHHSIYDGASSLFLLRDIFVAYQGEDIPTEEYTAFDFALDELKLLKSESYGEAEDYFGKLLDGSSTAVYPLSKERVGEEPDQGELDWKISGSNITPFCQDHNITPNSYFLTMMMHVLHAVTREERITITTINNGRSDGRMMGIMGMFVKTIPAVYAAGDEQVLTAVKNMQSQLLETQARDFYPFTTMVEKFGVRPEIMFVYQPSAGNTEGEEGEHFQLTLNQTKLPIEIMMMQDGDDFVMRLKYETSRYTRHDMLQLAAMVAAVAENAPMADKLQQVPLLTPEEKQNVMAISTGKSLDVDINMTYLDAFNAQAAKTPDSLAVADKQSELTYGQLAKYSDVLAHKLIDCGVEPNDFVCVMLDRMKEFPLSVLAIHKAGAAYTPLDFEYPNERLSYMLENSQAKVLITSHDVLTAKQAEGDFDTSNTLVIFIEDIDFTSETTPVNRTTPDNLAYMIYTSGSTGKPKGAMLHQAGLWNFIHVVIDMEQLTAADRIEGHRSFSFDAHIEDMYAILTLGGSFHIMPTEIRKDLGAIRQFLFDHQITGGGYSTAIAALLLNTYDDLPVRFITAGGEKLDGVHSDHIEIINVYGPTECTDDTSYYKIPAGKQVDNIPIGKSVANNYSFIVDAYGRLLPQGVAGELCFAGIQVGRGYWQLPERTAQAFCDCPFVTEDAFGRKVRMYHTGDLCRWNAEGDMEYISRIDTQVKLRGFRIELGEIENKVLLIQGIRQAAAEVRKAGGTDHLVLYYTVAEGQTIADDDIKAALNASSLAEYMVPDTYMKLDTMPMTPNGKIDRKKLPVPTITLGKIVAPETEREEQLLEMVKTLLNVTELGVTNNLVSAGMTSLSAMRFSAAVKQQLGIFIATKDILTHPTIREIAALDANGAEEAVKAYEKRDYYPVSENQRGIYIDWELNRETTQYNIPLVKEYARANSEKLRDALVATIEAHAYMKTRMSLKNGDVVQLRRDDAPIHIKMETLDYEPDEQFFQSRILPFNLFEDDLYRLEIYQTPTTTWLFMDMHHIIFDGGSNLVFLTDVERALNGESLEKEQFSAFDYSLYEQNMTSSSQYQKAEGYFDELLQGPELAVYPRSMKDTTAGNQELKISFARKDIVEWCRQNGVTESNFLLTVLLQVLHRTTREEQLYITTIDNGRSELNLLDCIGMFVKTLPITSNWDWTRSEVNMATAVHNTQNQFFDTKANSFYPFTKMVERHNIRPEIMYVYQGGLDNPMPASSEQGETPSKDKVISLTLDTAKLPLTVTVWPADADNYTLLLEYDGTLYNQKDMERLASMLSTFAVRSINATDLNTISMVDEATTEEVLRLSEGKTLPVDLTMTFAHMFTEQAHRTPDAPAVVDKSSQLTYAEMDTYSNLLASKLIALGIEPDDFVCVLLDRMKEFPLSVLAIHKAGAAYTPLDFEYPNDRLLYMMENSEAKVIVTTHDVLKAKKEEGDFEVGNAQLFFIDDFMNELSGKTLAELGEVKPIDLSSPDRLAYMIYTSGSTGKPKGAMLHQAGLANFIAVVKDMEKLTPADRISGHRSFSFDAHIEDMYPVLTLGGSFHIMPSEIRKDLGAIRQFLFDHQITGGGYSTAITCLLLNTFDDLPVRFITGGGEKMAGVYSDHIEIINVYGPTECTDDTSYFSIAPGKHIEEIPIGKSVANNWNFIVDQAGHLLPPGLAGELCFAGVQVGRGYWRLPERTEQSFVNCPFVKKDQWNRKVRMYHTGDLCRWNEDGELEYISRIDTQVKLRGFRIELGEIEKCAMNFGGMVTVVADVKTINGTQHLCMYFTADQEIDIEQLREMMSQTLTDYMVPEAFVKMDAMPMTPNGKIDRKKLPEPEIKVDTECVPPATKREEKLFEIAKELLGHDQFGVTDNLMRVGMTSLLVIRLVAKACNEDIKIKVDDFMRAKTIRGVLATNQRLMTWYQEPVAEKPVAVVIQGETRYNDLLPYIKELNERYNVVVVEAITTHFDYLFHDYDIHEAIEFYFAWLDALLMKAGLDSVSLFTGHCFGSDLAYRLACRWQQEYPEQPISVCMLDSFWVDRDRKLERPEFDMSTLPEDILKKIDEMNDAQEELLDMYKRLDCHGEPEPLKGNVLLISSAQKENIVAQIAENMGMKEDELLNFLKVDADNLRRFLIPQREIDNVALWSGFRSDLRSWKVYGDHMTMLNEQNVKTFMQFIFDNI